MEDTAPFSDLLRNPENQNNNNFIFLFCLIHDKQQNNFEKKNILKHTKTFSGKYLMAIIGIK